MLAGKKEKKKQCIIPKSYYAESCQRDSTVSIRRVQCPIPPQTPKCPEATTDVVAKAQASCRRTSQSRRLVVQTLPKARANASVAIVVASLPLAVEAFVNRGAGSDPQRNRCSRQAPLRRRQGRTRRRRGTFGGAIAAPCAPNRTKGLTLLHPAAFSLSVRNLCQLCTKTRFHFINTENAMARAPPCVQIVTVGS